MTNKQTILIIVNMEQSTEINMIINDVSSSDYSGILFEYDSQNKTLIKLNSLGLSFLNITIKDLKSGINPLKSIYKRDIINIRKELKEIIINASNHHCCSVRILNNKNKWETFFVKFKFLNSNGKKTIQGIAHHVPDQLINLNIFSHKKNIITNKSLDFLTNREKEIFELICDGLKNKEIAHRLHISRLTVETHRKRIIKKLKVNNSMELHKYNI